MSDDMPDRTIGGLAPREKKRDLSNMIARNRAAEPPADEPTPVAAPVAPREARQAPESPAPRKATKKQAAAKPAAPPVTPLESEPKKPVTIYLTQQVRNRARAAYRATAHLAGDDSWSAFVEAAVLAETRRREQEYNDGETYGGGEERLSPGRTVT